MTNTKGFINDMSTGKKASLIIGFLLIIAITAFLGIWAFSSKDSVLFSKLDDADAALMIEQLEEMKIPFSLTDGGKTILVDDRIVHETRLKLMAKGVNLAGGVGFEIFDDAEFGMTEYAQKINYQRALQGELSRTISALDEVKYARVHLVLPKSSLFSEEQTKAKASVTLVVENGVELKKKRIIGIQRLVAASISDMQPSQVTVLDQKGIPLSAAVSDTGFDAASSSRLEEKQAIESYLSQKALEVLEHSFGKGTSIVKVDVTLDHNKVKTTSENILGADGINNRGVLTRKRETISKQPIVKGDAKKGSKIQKNESSTTELDYKVGREIKESITAPGGITKISVGVILPAGTSSSQVNKALELISMVVGINKERGDKIFVQTLSESTDLLADIKLDTVGQEQVAPQVPVKNDLKELANSRSISYSQKSGKVVVDINYLKKNMWIFLAILLGVVIILVLMLWPGNKGLSSTKKSLTDDEKEAVLQEISEWIGVKSKGEKSGV